MIGPTLLFEGEEDVGQLPGMTERDHVRGFDLVVGPAVGGLGPAGGLPEGGVVRLPGVGGFSTEAHSEPKKALTTASATTSSAKDGPTTVVAEPTS